MKARIIPLMILVSLVLAVFSASPIRAGSKTTEYTGTMSLTYWEDLSLTKPGNAIHDEVYTEWTVDATDARVAGVYVLIGRCNWHATPFVGPCVTKWTLDNDGDGQPEWAGEFVAPGASNTVTWSGEGKGLDEYDGMHVKFKVQGWNEPPTVNGRVTGN